MASFLDYMNGYGESDYEKKKKEKEEEERRKKLISPADEIAPVKTYTPTSKKEDSKKEDDLKKDDDERTWFKKGSGGVINTILGTVADVGEDFSAGFIGVGEKVVDALAMLGTTLGNAQMSQLSNDELAFSALKNAGKDKETKEKEAESIVKKYTTAQKEAKKGTADFVKKDLYDEEEIAKKIITTPFQKATGINVEDSSVLGERSDSLVQSAGDMMATKLVDLILPGAGTVMMGLSAGGGEVEEALKQGATYEEAMASGMITAGAAMASGAAFNGVKFGGHTLTEGAVNKVATALSGKTLQTLAKWGINTAGEGFEEIAEDFISAVGKKVTYLNEKEFSELFNKESAWESFLGGILLGGFFEGIDVGVNKITGTDYVTGESKNALDENEQKVFDKVVEDRIAEATEDGKTISKKDESKIRNDVLRDMLKGYIDTDTIESLLGGEEYDKYKSFTDKASEYEAKLNEGIEKMQQRHDELQKEYNTLNKMKTGDMTGEQLDRRADIKKEMASLEDNIQQWNAELEEYSNDTKTSELKTNLKTKLGQSVFDLVKDSRLAESYREIERSKQKFEADVSKYKNENARQTVQNAIDSGLFGNGNRAKEFVDFAAKLSADRGYVIEFTDTKGLEKLKQEGNKYNLEADANRIEAFVSDKHKRIVVNADAHKSFDSLIGHEITHTLESAKSYEGLHKAIKSYLGDAEYNKTLEDFKKRYKGVNAVAEKELVAEFCGTKLLTDYDFVKHLSTENRNVFQKVWDEIKYLYKFATAGSKEARDLERVKRNFEKAYKESAKNTDTGVKHSLSDAQEAYFEDSKVRDENGNLKVMYHGTSKGGHTVFDTYGSKYGLFGQGSYFTDNKEIAESYTNKGKGDNKQVYETYLNITNPIDMDAEADVNAWAKALPDADFSNCTTNEDCYRAMEDYFEDEGYYKYEASEIAMDVMQGMGYDGITHIGGGRRTGTSDTSHRVYIAFEPEQIKNIDNIAPTNSADIRFSLDDALEKNGNLLYDKDSPLAIDNRAKSNNNSSLKWVYDSEIFSVKESKLFHSKISEINQGSEAFSKNSAGEYMIPIENKIVFTDGNYDSPYVREVVEVLTEYQTEFDAIRERIYNVEKGKSSKQDEVQIIKQMYGDGYIISYNSGNNGVYGWENGKRKGKSRSSVIRNYLNKQIRAGNDRASREAQINEIAPIKEASSEDGVFFDAQKTKFSLSEDSNGRKLTKEQEDYFKNVSPLLKDESGNIKRYYHGTARGDRVGTYFNPERATSGPMAFFTDNPEIAENYSKSKADTSMSYDSDYDSYETQFRVNINGNDMPLIDAWRYLPMSARARIKERAEHTHYDWDDYETLIYDEDTTEAGGGFSWQIREARGNILRALNEQWLNSGNLFNEEGKYIDVLKFIGVHDEFKKLGYGEPYYKDPYYREEKVFEVYLNVTNPFHTADVDEEFLNDARDYVDNTDLSIYESETADSDLWDKRSLDPYEWLDRLESDIENGTTHAWTSIPDVITDFLKEYGGYDGIVDAGGKHTGYGHQVVIPFYSEQIKNIDNETPTTDVHIDLSLSGEGEIFKDNGRFFGKDILYRGDDIAPVKETTEKSSATASKTEKVAPSVTEESSVVGTVNEDDYAPMTEAEAEAMYDRDYINSLTDTDMPPEMDAPIYMPDTTSIDDKALNTIAKTVKDALSLTTAETKAMKDIIQKYSTAEYQSEADLFEEIRTNFGEKSWNERNEEIANVKQVLRGYKVNVSPTIKRDITDYAQFRRRNFGKITFSKEGIPVDTAYMELSDTYPNFFPASITNATDQLLQMAEVANMEINETQTAMLDDESIQEATELIVDVVNTYKESELLKGAKAQGREFLKNANKYEEEIPKINNDFAPTKQYEAIEPRPDVLSDEEKQWAKNKMARADKVDTEEKPKRRSELHQSIVDRLKGKFKEKGFDFDKVLKNAKNLSTFATVDNIPQRVMEKALGYKQGQILADETVNKVAQNESEGIKWLNSFTDRKNGVLAQISKQYNIKPGSKKSAAAQMYAEGFYVDKNNEIIEYGDRELAIDFPDAKVQANIKGLARDPRIRQIYDETLAAINESRSRNLYPEIPRLDNYFLHFRAMDDTFSRLGLPFNPNDIRAKDLPTDLNGVTADLKPGQPYFASAKHREGMRTSFDLIGGLERYLSSAKNQIYHIDDIQTLRALRNYIADTYGQAKGLESLDDLSEEDVQERIKQVYGSHLSTFAKFLNEEANVLAGKTTLIDRGLEGIIGRRGITFLNTVNGQVGSNMVGWNISSSLTNILPVVQTMAKTNKFDFVKALAQTSADKISSLYGKSDGFKENSPVIIRRKGAERFYRTPFQKVGDAGYILMSAVDDVSTEIIARTKHNELTRKGMDSQQAHFETDKWVSRLMGDRSLGQQPQLYNSKMLGLVTKFQLEVRNQLDSQFYDTIQEAKASNEEIENTLLRNAETAAKVGSTFFQLAALQHIFGTAFESVAGYNPAFDIVEILIKTLGLDDDEEDEDTPLDNLEEGFLALLEDLPYTSTLTGGRIPISSALPITELIKGQDQYGNDVSRLDVLKEAAPYYILPTGYGQIKKSAKGLAMFSDEHPVAGSYTDSGNLRFPVEDTPLNRVQAAVFGQYANKNARTYFDEDYAPLKENQIKEYAEADMPIADYWKYREGLKDFTKQDEKAAYINGLDISKKQKDVLKSYLYDEEGYKEENPEKYAFLEREGIGYLGYKELDEDTQSAWSWAFKHQDEYEHYKENGVLPGDYSTYYIPMLEFEDEDDEAYQWSFDNPEKATVGKVFGEGVKEYRQYAKDLNEIKADKDENGKSISGSAKEKKKAYIWSLPIDYGQKIILYRSLYDSKDDKATYNQDILDYLFNREDLTYEEVNTICEELGFTVNRDTGYISWD